MRKRNFKKLAALFIIAVYALSTFAFASAAEDLGGFEGIHATISRSDEYANGGSYSMKVVLPDEAPDYANYGRIDLLKYLESGNEYEISFYVYQDQVETAKGLTTTLNYQQADGDEQWLNEGTYGNWINEKQWSQIKRPVDLTEGGELTKAALYFETIEVDFYIDDFVVYDVTNEVEVLKIDFEVEEDEKPVDEDDKEDEKPVDEDDKEDEKPADEDDKNDNEKDKEPEKPKSVSFTFEEDLQGWTGIDQAEVDANYDDTVDVTTLSRSDEQAADGKYSLKAVFKPGNVHYQARMPIDNVKPGQKVTFKVYIPKGTNLKGYQIFSQGAEDWSYWDDKWFDVKEEGVWLEGEYTIPENIKDPIQRVALQFVFDKALDKEAFVYIDSVVLGADDDEVPAKTGYASTLGYLLLAAASAGVIAKKKRK